MSASAAFAERWSWNCLHSCCTVCASLRSTGCNVSLEAPFGGYLGPVFRALLCLV